MKKRAIFITFGLLVNTTILLAQQRTIDPSQSSTIYLCPGDYQLNVDVHYPDGEIHDANGLCTQEQIFFAIHHLGSEILDYQNNGEFDEEDPFRSDYYTINKHGADLLVPFDDAGEPQGVFNNINPYILKLADNNKSLNLNIELFMNPSWVDQTEHDQFTVIVYQTRMKGVFQCNIEEIREIDRFTIHAGPVEPSGQIIPEDPKVLITPTSGAEIRTRYETGYFNNNRLIKFDTEIGRRYDGETTWEAGGTDISWRPKWRTFFRNGVYETEVTEPGSYSIKYIMTDACGFEYTQTSIPVTADYTCSNGSSNYRLQMSGPTVKSPGEVIYEDEWETVTTDSWVVPTDEVITIDVSGVDFEDEFDEYYDLDFDGEGSGKIEYLGNKQFRVDPSVKTGRYKVTPVFKYNTEYLDECDADLEATDFTVGGYNQHYDAKCALTIPDDLFADEHVYVDEGDDYGWIFSYFRWRFESDRAVIIKPGATLTQGAEIEAFNPHIKDDPDTTADRDINYIHSATYDEWGYVLSESKSYYDDLGKQLQVQRKNLTSEVVLAEQTIYDRYGRPTVKTLPAPVRGAKYEYDSECEDRVQIGGNLQLAYEPDFVRASNGQPYSYKNFDENYSQSKGNNPDPLDKSQPGTLGWYYSRENIVRSEDYDYIELDHPIAEADENITKTVIARRAVTLKPGFHATQGNTFQGTIDPELPLSPDEINYDTDATQMAEENVPVTDYPFTRKVFNPNGSNEVITQIMPGDHHQLGSGHEGDKRSLALDASDNGILDTYLDMRVDVFEGLLPRNETLLDNAYKSTTIDANNHQTTVYYDNAGKELIVRSHGTTDLLSFKFYNTQGDEVASVSPKGVEAYMGGASYGVIDKTTYSYNFRGQMVRAESNDVGEVNIMYASDGRVRFSQNELQESTFEKYSYTNYDSLGRPVESGECMPASGWEFNSDSLRNILNAFGTEGECVGTKTDITYTAYDVAYEESDSSFQQFIDGNVSYTYTKEAETGNINMLYIYSYDEKGRVTRMVQHTNDLEEITIDYQYGRMGNVSVVEYQPGSEEEFYHYYYYNNDAQLASVYVSTQKYSWNRARHLGTMIAGYEYYKHGSLKRSEIGRTLQGTDYIYNINGWLKAINNPQPGQDPGKDGMQNEFNEDVFAMSLEYFNGDYTSNNNLEEVDVPDPLYDGSITAMTWMTKKPQAALDNGLTESPEMYTYGYDNNYQLTGARYAEPLYASNSYSPEGNTFRVDVGDYDPNGNIGYVDRYDETGSLMDDFNYNYSDPNDNQLTSVDGYGSYEYNQIGQLREDNVGEYGTRHYAYNASGKVTGVYTDWQHDNPIVEYKYDPNGFRVKKINSSGETVYVRDASGNLLSVYEKSTDSVDYKRTEAPLYASDRVGVVTTHEDNSIDFVFESKNHLGNVVNTYKPEDNNFGIEKAIVADMSVDYNQNTILENTQINFTAFESPGVTIGEVTAQLKSGQEIEATAYIDAEGNVALQDIVNPMKYNYEASASIGRFEFDLPQRSVTARIEVDEHGDGVAYDVSPDFTTYGDAGVLIESVSSTVTTGGEEQITASVYDNGSGGVTISDIVSEVKSDTEEMHDLGDITFDLDDRNVRADIKVDPEGNGSASSIWRNFSVDYPDNFTIGEFTGGPASGVGTEEVTATLKTSGENIRLEAITSTETSGAPEQKWFGKVAFYFDNQEINNNIELLSFTDYYPFGSPMSGRKYVGSKAYRFGYQGQFAEDETDETGYNAFEARLYDAKIGRWTTIDPAGQYYSPYLGMGNNWLNGTDPDGEKWYQNSSGGFEWHTGFGSWKAFFSSDLKMTPRFGTTTNFTGDGWSVTSDPFTVEGSIPSMVEGPGGGMIPNVMKFAQNGPGAISTYEPNFFGNLQNKPYMDNIVSKAAYNMADDFYVYGTKLILGGRYAHHLDGSGANRNEVLDAGVNTISNFIPVGSIGKAVNVPKLTLNAGQFNALYKAAGININAATNGGREILLYNINSRVHGSFIRTNNIIGIGSKLSSGLGD